MLETSKWIQKFFDRSSDALLIFQEDELVLSNQLARELLDQLDLKLTYLLQVARNKITQQQNVVDNCFNCAILDHMPNHIIPLTLTTKTGQKLHYSITYQVLDEENEVLAIELKSQEALHRANELAQQKQLNQYVNRAYEDERKRISRDLHDSIAQGLYSARMGIQRIENEKLSPDELQAIAEMVETQLDDTLAEVKGMALEIRPSVLDSFGLVAALKALTKRLQENSGVGFTVINQVNGTHLSDDVKSVLYRVAQEAISNALRHANPTEVTIMLVTHPNFISLEVIDDGDGFVVNSNKDDYNGHSMGLMNMNERIKALNGTFNIDSALGEGTTVMVLFPITKSNYQKEETINE